MSRWGLSGRLGGAWWATPPSSQPDCPRATHCDDGSGSPSIRHHEPAPVPPLHLDAVGIFSTVPLAGFFPARHRRTRGEFFARLFQIAPVRHRVGVTLVFHEYQSRTRGIKEEMAGGESVRERKREWPWPGRFVMRGRYNGCVPARGLGKASGPVTVE